ncbi:fumarylacetoacetate hydrolase [Mariannaea sp. PMI_226]|nr:fumarylacetoacetate hydrolase [Mariannaea sp. PMI_226]
MPDFVQFPLTIPEGSPFPISNIPFGIFSTALDGSLNKFAELSGEARAKVRRDIQNLIRDATSPLYDPQEQDRLLLPSKHVELHLPMKVGAFTDFMCSLEHVTNGGRLAGASSVLPNFFHLPLGYNGRASSVLVSGTPIARPYGMVPGIGSSVPEFVPSKRLDYEVEMGIFISKPVQHGELIPAYRARDHIFGLVLLNDWSARDIQMYEMTPLGPFNGKACGTSISPWVVTLDALEEAGAFITAEAAGLQGGKATSVKFLTCQHDLDIDVSASISRENGKYSAAISRSNMKHLHWSPFQMVAHHTSAGCGLGAGDLLGTGTLSSSREQASQDAGESGNGVFRLGCLFELTENGTKPVELGENLSVAWLEDGDEIILEAWAGRGRNRIGFGQVTGRILPARLMDV